VCLTAQLGEHGEWSEVYPSQSPESDLSSQIRMTFGRNICRTKSELMIEARMNLAIQVLRPLRLLEYFLFAISAGFC
jgi:hypothetical protein